MVENFIEKHEVPPASGQGVEFSGITGGGQTAFADLASAVNKDMQAARIYVAHTFGTPVLTDPRTDFGGDGRKPVTPDAPTIPGTHAPTTVTPGLPSENQNDVKKPKDPIPEVERPSEIPNNRLARPENQKHVLEKPSDLPNWPEPKPTYEDPKTHLIDNSLPRYEPSRSSWLPLEERVWSAKMDLARRNFGSRVY